MDYKGCPRTSGSPLVSFSLGKKTQVIKKISPKKPLTNLPVYEMNSKRMMMYSSDNVFIVIMFVQRRYMCIDGIYFVGTYTYMV